MRDPITGMPADFGGLQWKDITTIHPVGLAAVLLCGTAMLFLPRRWVSFPIMLVACFIPAVQKIAIFEFDFNVLRIMVLFGLARLFLYGETSQLRWKRIDTAIVLWVIVSVVLYSALHGTMSAFVNRLGFTLDALGTYFLFRCLIRRWEDVDALVLGMSVIGVVVAIFFFMENRTGYNVFSVFGGVEAITVAREGKLRCQGAFAHPILAGCFWASWMPLIAAQWWRKDRGRFWAVVGLAASTIIILLTASSTPMAAACIGVVGAAMFLLRYQMRLIWWGILASLIALHIVMEAPVWHLISRISFVGGSTGYHRYVVIDQAIRHLGEWWLMGVRSTLHWPGQAGSLFDITNQYVVEGVTGGLPKLGLFVAIIGLAFSGVGRLWRQYRNDPSRVALSWAMGVSLLIHCASFIGVSYFGQIWVVWYSLLAMIGSLSPAKEYLPHRGVTTVKPSTAGADVASYSR